MSELLTEETGDGTGRGWSRWRLTPLPFFSTTRLSKVPGVKEGEGRKNRCVDKGLGRVFSKGFSPERTREGVLDGFSLVKSWASGDDRSMEGSRGRGMG